MHDGNRYFEHCYGADFDRRVTPAQNEACWSAWLAHYTRHQPAHRVDYAMRRVEAIQASEPQLRLPGLQQGGGAAQIDPAQQALLKTAQAGAQPGSATALTETSIPSIPNGCLTACNTYEAGCLADCEATSVSCRQGCTRERAICLGACY